VTGSRFAGKVAIVTGSARGLGKATALKLAREGAPVVICDVRRELAEGVVRQITESGGHAMVQVVDVSDEAQVNAMVADVAARFGTIDILVNNAGVMHTTNPMETIPLADLQAMFAVNVEGVFLCIKAVLPIMKAKRSGKIVNTSSSAGRSVSTFCGMHYTASKAAVLGITRHTAREAAPYNVNVNAIAPGTFITEGGLELLPDATPELMQQLEQAIPMHRFGTPEDIANLVAFLCSEESYYITGATIDNNGGDLMMYRADASGIAVVCNTDAMELEDSMKVLISADMEGITGVVVPNHTSHTHPEYGRFRSLMTGDVNAAIEGAVAGGADRIVVNDSHGMQTNILIEALNPAAELISGVLKPFDMMQGIGRDVDAVFLVGYHARAGTTNGVLAHTMTGTTLSVRLNGQEVGETGLSAALAGAFGVPVVLVTGDQAVTAEARALLGDLETVVVKQGLSQAAAQCLTPPAAHVRIREAAQRALSLRLRPFVVPSPVTLSVTFQLPAHADLADKVPESRRLDGRTVEWVGGDTVAAYRAFSAMWGLSMMVEMLKS
jgi:D-amino peptidase